MNQGIAVQTEKGSSHEAALEAVRILIRTIDGSRLLKAIDPKLRPGRKSTPSKVSRFTYVGAAGEAVVDHRDEWNLEWKVQPAGGDTVRIRLNHVLDRPFKRAELIGKPLDGLKASLESFIHAMDEPIREADPTHLAEVMDRIHSVTKRGGLVAERTTIRLAGPTSEAWGRGYDHEGHVSCELTPKGGTHLASDPGRHLDVGYNPSFKIHRLSALTYMAKDSDLGGPVEMMRIMSRSAGMPDDMFRPAGKHRTRSPRANA